MVSKADYLNYMQGSGYETSPIYQQGVERWDPESLESAQLEQLYGSPLNKYIWDAAGMAGSDTGMYVPGPSEGQKERGYYDQFQDVMGHEASHLGFDYDPYRKGIAEFGGTTNPLSEENWNYMHDLMYGVPDMYGTQRDYLINKGLYSLPTPVFGGQFGKRIGSTPGGWTPKTYDKIRGSGLVDWQKGMLMQGPTTAAGQVALNAQVKKGPMRQTPDQVRAQGQAYMDPDRGNVQAPTMTSSQIRQEADRTGGTRHAGEMTQAAAREAPQPSSYSNVRRYGRARGGIASLWQR